MVEHGEVLFKVGRFLCAPGVHGETRAVRQHHLMDRYDGQKISTIKGPPPPKKKKKVPAPGRQNLHVKSNRKKPGTRSIWDFQCFGSFSLMSPTCGASCSLKPKDASAVYGHFLRNNFGLVSGGGGGEHRGKCCHLMSNCQRYCPLLCGRSKSQHVVGRLRRRASST